MKTMVRTIAACGMSGLIAFLAGCSNSSPTGVGSTDNQEISVESAGKLAVATLNESQQFDQCASSMDAASGRLAVTAFPATPAFDKALGKAAAISSSGNDSCIIDSSRISEGIVSIIAYQENALYTSYDTVVILWDEFAEDQIQDNESVISVSGRKEYASGRREWYSIVDLDDDGVVKGRPAVTKTARITGGTIFAGPRDGESEVLVLNVDAGVDQDFDLEEDNRIIGLASWAKMRDGDTLAYASYADGDNDGFVFAGAGQQSVIDITLYERDPGLFVKWHRLLFRLVSNGNEAEDVIIKLYGEQEHRSGRRTKVVALDQDGDSVITDGDMAHVTWSTLYSPESDSIISAEIGWVYDPQSGLQNESDNLLYGLSMNETKRFGFVRERVFAFTTDQPIRSGEDPVSGHLELRVTYLNGKSVSVVADFAAGEFSGVYTGPDGETLEVTWNADGEVVASAQQ